VQTLTAEPRQNLTAEQVVGLIQDAPGVIIGSGLEIIDLGLNVIEDISADLAGGSVSRSSYATLHGSCKLGISRDLAWGSVLLRPYYTMTDGITLARFNLGAYYTSTPARELEQTPVTFDVDGFDMLLALDDPVGSSYAIDAGRAYLAEVEAILLALGYTAYAIDQTAAAKVLPTARVWVLDDNLSWLTIVNDLLAAVGYAGIWSDWDGRLRVNPYILPSGRGPEWTYNADRVTAMLGSSRSIVRDFFRTPNRWVFRRGNDMDGPAPVEGNGVYTVLNQDQGDTSIDGRGGRVITRAEALDVADHESLVSTADRLIDDDKRIAVKLTLTTFPNPLHWHFDRLHVDDPRMAGVSEILGTSWTLPLTGGDQTHEWTAL
jgi:hypothetical protein